MQMKAIGVNLGPSLLVVAVLTTVCVAVLSLPAENEAGQAMESDQQAAAIRDKPYLFDFEHYQRLFNKKYGSHLEETTRRCYFLAKAFMAYLSGVAYKFWKKTYYLAVNEFSDWSKEELDMTRNKAMAMASDDILKVTEGIQKKDVTARTETSPKTVAVDFDPEKVASELENEIDQTIRNLQHNSLTVDEDSKRRKRDVESQDNADDETNLRRRRPRHLSMDQLIQGSGPVKQPANVLAKIDRSPKSNNKHYDPLLFKGMTMGLVDEQERLTYSVLRDPNEQSGLRDPNEQSGLLDAAKAVVNFYVSTYVYLYQKYAPDALKKSRLFGSKDVDAEENLLPDELFADLRQSGCLLEPKRQHKCGSCYAFASITMAEYLYCNATGKLVGFSEQYMVDCGKVYVNGTYGCDGGGYFGPPNFIHNFGLELAKTYPYVGREGECPYEQDMNIEKTGYIRMNLTNVAFVGLSRWPELLKYGPINIGFMTQPDFEQYGGGVYDGSGCGEQPDHAMVVIGHGREFGKEYWLMRNSHGVHWGEKGYFKLAKSASEKCIYDNKGVIYGTYDGVEFKLEPYVNNNHDPSILARMQALAAQQEQTDEQTDSDGEKKSSPEDEPKEVS